MNSAASPLRSTCSMATRCHAWSCAWRPTDRCCTATAPSATSRRARPRGHPGRRCWPSNAAMPSSSLLRLQADFSLIARVQPPRRVARRRGLAAGPGAAGARGGPLPLRADRRDAGHARRAVGARPRRPVPAAGRQRAGDDRVVHARLRCAACLPTGATPAPSGGTRMRSSATPWPRSSARRARARSSRTSNARWPCAIRSPTNASWRGRTDGRSWLQVDMVPHFGPDGQAVAGFVLISDITERRIAERCCANRKNAWRLSCRPASRASPSTRAASSPTARRRCASCRATRWTN